MITVQATSIYAASYLLNIRFHTMRSRGPECHTKYLMLGGPGKLYVFKQEKEEVSTELLFFILEHTGVLFVNDSAIGKKMNCNYSSRMDHEFVNILSVCLSVSFNCLFKNILNGE